MAGAGGPLGQQNAQTVAFSESLLRAFFNAPS
jgi:hypothetical protein